MIRDHADFIMQNCRDFRDVFLGGNSFHSEHDQQGPNRTREHWTKVKRREKKQKKKREKAGKPNKETSGNVSDAAGLDF